MTNSNKLVPRLRFKNDEGHEFPVWKARPLGELGKTYNGLTGKNKAHFGSGSPYIQYLQIFEKSKINVDGCGLVEVDDGENQNKVKNGDIFFTTSSETPNEVGTASALLDDVDNMYLNSFCFGYRVREGLSSNFARFAFRVQNFRKKIARLAQGSTRYNLSKSHFIKVLVNLPRLEEQQKIASFLSAVDRKIEQLKHKKTLLEQFKKGMMQKLFSQEIRFKDDEGREYPQWQVKLLQNIANVKNGDSNRVDSDLEGEYAFFDRSQDVRRSKIYIFDTEAVIVAGEGQEFIPKYFIGKFDLHQRSYAIYDFECTAGKFVYYYLTQNNRYFLKYAVGSTVKSLRLPAFKLMPVSLPCLEEQHKIASFLSSIDKKIELVENQIELAQSFKKGLLQQMFV